MLTPPSLSSPVLCDGGVQSAVVADVCDPRSWVGHFVRSVTSCLKGITLSEPDRADTQANRQMPTVKQIVARVQDLCDAPKPDGRYPLATYVEG